MSSSASFIRNKSSGIFLLAPPEQEPTPDTLTITWAVTNFMTAASTLKCLPKITLSDRMDGDLQPYAALHEELCQNHKPRIDTCAKIEEIVVDSVPCSTLRERYVAMRLDMFEALRDLNPGIQDFQESEQFLRTLQGR
jgi:hypothetical protein